MIGGGVMRVIMGVLLAVSCVMRMIMGVEVCPLFPPGHQHPDVGPQNAAAFLALRCVFHIRDPQGVQLPDGFPRIRSQLQQGGGEHIPRRPHSAVKIQCFHFGSPNPMRSVYSIMF